MEAVETVEPVAVKKKTTQSDAQTVVEDFLHACSTLDLDAALELIAEDCVYKNVPFHTARGKRNVVKAFQAMGKAVTEFKVDMLNIATNGNVVLTERVDTLGGKYFRAELPIMGVFVVKDGKITEWRDYFDWSLSFGKFVGSLFSSPFRK
ncbi:MAG TPA: limonene-1,2-epoxide hydrolase family protein [Dongiaceae bacterium]|nr:limonene-1,2-epoxide hydrolase family protein [Dongiaceae bacterium]